RTSSDLLAAPKRFALAARVGSHDSSELYLLILQFDGSASGHGYFSFLLRRLAPFQVCLDSQVRAKKKGTHSIAFLWHCWHGFAAEKSESGAEASLALHRKA